MSAAIWAVTSGKGGVGKSSLTANLAISLTKLGQRVAVLDADMGLANIDVLLGLCPKRTIEHFFRDGIDLEEIAIEGPGGVRVIAGSSGLPELTALATPDLVRLVAGLKRLSESCDVMIIDTAAGIGEQVMRMVTLAQRVLLVTWPEPTALVDAYAALKSWRGRRPGQEIGLIVNGAADAEEAQRVHARLSAATEKFLGTRVGLEGFVPWDEAVVDAVRRQQAVVISHPLSPASRGFERLALHLAARLRRATPGSGEPCQNGERAAELLH